MRGDSSQESEQTERGTRLPEPYVGFLPFGEEDKKIFFGRNQETDDLVSLLFAHQCVLLYAQSGAGKTSLINAGLLPLLRDEGFDVLPPVRVRGPELSTVELQDLANPYVFYALFHLLDTSSDIRGIMKQEIADYLDQQPRMVSDDGTDMSRVLIIDQFEELFTSYQERWWDREDFFSQIGKALERDSTLRILFVIREDYIALLDPYLVYIPEHLGTRFRLERLGRKAALEATTGPLTALKTRREFGDGVAEQLVKNLRLIRVTLASGDVISVEGPYIEPVQLGVVCYSLWENLPDDVTVIKSDHIQQFGDADTVLAEYYASAVTKAVQQQMDEKISEKKLRNWFEQELITPAETRGIVYQGDYDTLGIPNDMVDYLGNNRHIIRGEWRAGARWLELTHDRFVEPILASNRQWREEHQSILSITTEEWLRLDRDPGVLLRGVRLAEAGRWVQEHGNELDPTEREFLAASSELARQKRVRERWVMGLVGVLILVVSALVIAVKNWEYAQEAVARAFVQRAISDLNPSSPQKAEWWLNQALEQDKSLGREVAPLFVQIGELYLEQRQESEGGGVEKARSLFERASVLDSDLNIDPDTEVKIVNAVNLIRMAQNKEEADSVRDMLVGLDIRDPRKADVANEYYRWWCMEQQTENSEEIVSPKCSKIVNDALITDNIELAYFICTDQTLAETRGGESLASEACERTKKAANRIKFDDGTPQTYSDTELGMDQNHFWVVQLANGEDVRIEVTRTDDRSLFDPVVSLVGPDGPIMQRLEQSDDNLNSTLDAAITTTVEETGDYLVVVEGHRSYGEYKLMLSKSTNELLSFKVSEAAE